MRFASWLRRVRAYTAIVEMVPKLYVAYRAWFWAGLFVQTLVLVIVVYFWRAVYADRTTLGGLPLQQTLNYVMLAQVLVPMVESKLVFFFGQMLVEGKLIMELLRPVDLQARFWVEATTFLFIDLFMRLPLAVFAWLVFGLSLPSEPTVWGAFLVSLLLGQGVMFLFNWIFACLAFYTTESWGLGMVQQGVATFFSGALVPLALMPDWLERLALSLPFAQVLYMPLALLSGITPVAEAPRVWLVQALWLAGLLVASRLIFGVAVRRITVQGG
ncbi:MAG: hypothetical protein GY769_20620 [bacterium]|nr:hypothetical protein [bacterium]